MSSVADLLMDLPEADAAAATAVARRAADVLRPRAAFARLDEAATWLAGWQRTEHPKVAHPVAIVFVGDHGVVARRVSAYPRSVTAAMLDALKRGAATAAVIATDVGAHLSVVDVGVGRPTGDITVEPAMDETRFWKSFDAGRAAVESLDTDLLVLGEMGIGNTTAAAAVAAALFGLPAEDWTGRGTGIDDETFARKLEAVETARRRVGSGDPFETLRQLGGAEMVALAGATVAARRRSIPVVLDGFVVTAAVAPLEAARPGALDHCIAGHRSPEPGHSLLLEKLGKQPLLDLGLRLGEGSGALLAVPLLKSAARAVTDVATFDEWGLR